MVMVRMTMPAVIVMVMVGIVASAVTVIVARGVPTTTVPLPVIIARCHRSTSGTFQPCSVYPKFLTPNYRAHGYGPAGSRGGAENCGESHTDIPLRINRGPVLAISRSPSPQHIPRKTTGQQGWGPKLGIVKLADPGRLFAAPLG
jgi:hypothetical protein